MHKDDMGRKESMLLDSKAFSEWKRAESASVLSGQVAEGLCKRVVIMCQKVMNSTNLTQQVQHSAVSMDETRG